MSTTSSPPGGGTAEAWRDVQVDPSRVRPRNMFDVTNLTYEQYVEKHYEIMLKNHQESLQAQQQQQQLQMQQQQQHMLMQQQQQQQQQQQGSAAGYRR